MKNNRKGFTLAELLIVVAIIAVLVAIAIPIFANQLEKSKEATDVANVRAAYAEVVANYLTENEEQEISVAARQGISGWQGEAGYVVVQSGGVQTQLPFSAKYNAGDDYLVAIDVSGNLTIN